MHSKWWLKLFVTILFISLLFFLLKDKVEWNRVNELLFNITVPVLSYLLILTVIQNFIKVVNLKFILENYCTTSNLHIMHVLIPVFAANTLNLFIPGRGGEIIKIYYLKDKIPIGTTLGAVLLERWVDVFCLTFLSLIACLYLYIWNLSFFMGLFLIFWFIILAVSVNKIFYTFFQRFLPEIALEHFRELRLFFSGISFNRSCIFIIIAFSQWLIALYQCYFIFVVLDSKINVLYAFAIVPAGILVSMLPFSIGGVGTREAAFILLFKELTTTEIIIAFSLLFFVFRVFSRGILGIPFLAYLSFSRRNEYE